MRMLGREGANVLEAGGEMSGPWEEIRTIFGYGCEDEADDWWVQWGVMQERVARWTIPEETAVAVVSKEEEVALASGSDE